jgi:hypothetical protein
MEIDVARTAVYVGAGGAVGGGFAALGSSGSKVTVGLGIATGVLAGGVQTFVHERTGSSELGWLAAIGSGSAAGAVLLGGMAKAGATPIAARGVGAAIGGTIGILAPVVAGMVLAQLREAPGA